MSPTFRPLSPEELLTPVEAGELLEVTPKTVARYADAGRLQVRRTLGGHRRYPAAQVRALVELERVVVAAPNPTERTHAHPLSVAGRACHQAPSARSVAP